MFNPTTEAERYTYRRWNPLIALYPVYRAGMVGLLPSRYALDYTWLLHNEMG
jgi:hypothetical protein